MEHLFALPHTHTHRTVRCASRPEGQSSGKCNAHFNSYCASNTPSLLLPQPLSTAALTSTSSLLGSSSTATVHGQSATETCRRANPFRLAQASLSSFLDSPSDYLLSDSTYSNHTLVSSTADNKATTAAARSASTAWNSLSPCLTMQPHCR